jgi:aryl-alcohol dehydrogenase-like predicted oxidoreductase
MKQRRLGRTGLVVSEIGMGTMTFGSMADEQASHAIMDRAIDAGINFFDAAEMYPVPPNPKWAGKTEEIVGKWMAGRSRDSIILASKVTGSGGGWPIARWPAVCSRASTRAAPGPNPRAFRPIARTPCEVKR